MRLLLLLLATLATTANANGTDDANTTEDVAPFSVLANATLSCSLKAPSLTVGCYLERPVLVAGPLELSVGVDAQAALTGGESHLAPYASASWYGGTWSAWIEVIFPDLGIPILGAPDWLRLGFTLRL